MKDDNGHRAARRVAALRSIPPLARGRFVPDPPDPPEALQPVDGPSRVPAATSALTPAPTPAPTPTPARTLIAVAVLCLAVTGGVVLRAVTSGAGELVETAHEPRPQISAAATGQVGAPGSSPRSSLPVHPSGGPAGAVVQPSAPVTQVVVDVVGHVRRPGVVRLSEGARVSDAVHAAGGPDPGAAIHRLNLARRLVDGEQVVVPGPRDPVAPQGAVAGAASGSVSGSVPGSGGGSLPGEQPSAAPVDLNTATLAQLDALPGVGAVTAGRIIAWRTQHGSFSRVEELGEVDGIGPKMLQRLRPLVRVGGSS